MPETPPRAGWAEEHIREQLTSALERAASGPASDGTASPEASPRAEEKPWDDVDEFGALNADPDMPSLRPQTGSVSGATGRTHSDAGDPCSPPPALKPSRPITFNAAMVRAILAGNKTQTRRPIRPAPARLTERRNRPWPADERGQPMHCTLASYGEILWVREPWTQDGTFRGQPKIEFEADFGPAAAKEKAPWRAGRFLPRELSRLELEVRSIWPQRLGELSPQDAIAEGVSPVLFEDDPAGAIEEFRRMWDAFYGLTDFAWENNPWVWVVRFKSVEPPEDE